MPFTVSCAACNSRFLLGDDLFQRKVSGKVVTVKCRSCNADISVDATEAATLPSQEAPAPRPRPAPPRPKHKQGDATATPMPATATPMPATATTSATPRRGAATATPLPAGALLSIWDAAERSVEAPRKAPPPRRQTSAHVRQAEFIEDIEEAPPSSSSAPTLSALKIEVHPPRRNNALKKAPDDFLVNLSAGSGGILGMPTIDVMGLTSAAPANVEELLEVEATELTPPIGTLPLFDMSAVLPVANRAANSGAAARPPADVDVPIDVEMPPTPSESGKRRERKYVIAPETREAVPAPKTRRAGAAVWFVLVAAAASVLLVVGLRHGSSQPASPEPQPAVNPVVPAPAVAPSDVAAALPAPIPATASAPIAAASASPGKPSAPATPVSVAPSSVKTPVSSVASEPDKPKAEAAPAVEKPTPLEKPATPIAAKPEPAEPGTEFDRAAAVAALKAAAAEAAGCRKDGDPSGTASLTITFAPSGRVTSANIQGPPFAGTPTGGCIASAMRHAHVPPFSGERVTVNKTIVVQ